MYVTDVSFWIVEINVHQVKSVLTPDWEEVLEDDGGIVGWIRSFYI